MSVISRSLPGMGVQTPEDRRSFLRQIALFYLIATAISSLALYLPVTPAGRPVFAITFEVVLGVAAAGVIYAVPWHRFHEDWFVTMGMVAVAQLGVFIWATGGVQSPFWPMVLFNVVGAAAYYKGGRPVALMAVTSVAAVIAPFFYDRPLTATQATDLAIRGMVISVAFIFSWVAAKQIKRHAELATKLLDEQAAVGRRRQFVQLVGHEMRTPLMLLQGHGERLMARQELPEGARQDLAAMQRSWERMKRLLEDLREYDSVEGRVSLQRVNADIGKVMQEAVAGQLQLVPGRPFTVAIEGPAVTLCDPFRLTQVANNLLQNANRYSPEGAPIRVEVARRDAGIQVSVKDSGVGIPPEIQDKIFTAFFRGRQKGIENVPGSGLGLSIAKEIVEAHGGRIWFESTPGQGTTFFFTVPAK